MEPFTVPSHTKFRWSAAIPGAIAGAHCAYTNGITLGDIAVGVTLPLCYTAIMGAASAHYHRDLEDGRSSLDQEVAQALAESDTPASAMEKTIVAASYSSVLGFAAGYSVVSLLKR